MPVLVCFFACLFLAAWAALCVTNWLPVCSTYPVQLQLSQWYDNTTIFRSVRSMQTRFVRALAWPRFALVPLIGVGPCGSYAPTVRYQTFTDACVPVRDDKSSDSYGFDYEEFSDVTL
jgi:hypothetical protein